MSRNIFAGGGVQTFQGSNNPLYVQNMNSLKAAFTDLQDSISIAAPIGAVLMWSGACTLPADIPAGFAVCNGAYLDIATYSTLYAIIGTRYGSLVGSTFRLPDLTSRIPRGTVGTPTVPTTVTTSVSSAVDAHTHTVNSALTGANSNLALSGANSNIGINTGNVSAHTHSGGTRSGANSNIGLTVGNAAAHSHVVTGNTGNQSAGHVHSYFKPNSGTNTNTGGNNTNHTHAMLFNSQNANATGLNTAINGANSNIGINAQGAPNTTLTIALTGANSNISTTGANSNLALTAGNATTISAPVLTHTHTTDITELVFIIKVI
jgi:microcystin-dependent protein